MTRTIYVALAALIYALFFATFLYLIGFVADLAVLPATVDRGLAPSGPAAALVDLGLVALFGLQHSAMARQGFKAAWTRIVPEPLERSVYVLTSSIVLLILFALWQPLLTPVWTVGGAAAILLWVLFAAGWAIVLLSTFLINHFELFGLTQAYSHWRRTSVADPRFRTPLLYRLVRHPLYAGFLIAFWATPAMTVGHVLLAAGLSAYVLIAIRLEERDLGRLFGDDYAAYQASTGMLVPGVGRRR